MTKRINGLNSCYLLAPIYLLVLRFINCSVAWKYCCSHTVFNTWLVHIYTWRECDIYWPRTLIQTVLWPTTFLVLPHWLKAQGRRFFMKIHSELLVPFFRLLKHVFQRLWNLSVSQCIFEVWHFVLIWVKLGHVLIFDCKSVGGGSIHDTRFQVISNKWVFLFA